MINNAKRERKGNEKKILYFHLNVLMVGSGEERHYIGRCAQQMWNSNHPYMSFIVS